MKKKLETNLFEAISKLLKVIAKLRDPINGCPWDIKQNHESLIPFVIEEAHEVADAIRFGDKDNLIEELGDLLLQVLLHAQIASEAKTFYLKDIVEKLTKKLIRRHPHVFNNEIANTMEDVNKIWEAAKAKENKRKSTVNTLSKRLKLKTRSQSVLTGAMNISKKTASAGFEWNSVNEVWDKFDEEVQEFKEALNNKSKIHAQEELGDVIFTLTNIARWYSINPEEGLASTNKKFLERFSYIEESLNGELSNRSLKELKYLWEKAKKEIDNTLEEEENKNGF